MYERDIDVLMQEELIFNDAVCDVFARALGIQSRLHVTQCALSVVDLTGETDLLARFTDEGDNRGVLLIENKIDDYGQFRERPRSRRSNQLGAKTAN